MARLRTFIAVDLGTPIQDRLASLQQDLAKATTGVKWTAHENLHVTLLFLGEVQDREIPAVCKAVEAVTRNTAAFPVRVQGAGCFPNPRRPRVLWVGVGAGALELVALHDALEPSLLALGCYRREERHFTPHVTLGRVRNEQAPAGLAQALARHHDWSAGDTTVREVLVMSSELTSAGPHYTILSRAKLRSSDA